MAEGLRGRGGHRFEWFSTDREKFLPNAVSTVALGKLARQRAPPSATLLPPAPWHMSHGHDIGRVCVRVVINKQTDKPAASEHNRVLQDTTQLLTDC